MMSMTVRRLRVDLDDNEWKAFLVIRALVGADSWNDFFQLLVRDPQKFIFSLVQRTDPLKDMKDIAEKIEKGEISADEE